MSLGFCKDCRHWERFSAFQSDHYCCGEDVGTCVLASKWQHPLKLRTLTSLGEQAMVVTHEKHGCFAYQRQRRKPKTRSGLEADVLIPLSRESRLLLLADLAIRCWRRAEASILRRQQPLTPITSHLERIRTAHALIRMRTMLNAFVEMMHQ